MSFFGRKEKRNKAARGTGKARRTCGTGIRAAGQRASGRKRKNRARKTRGTDCDGSGDCGTMITQTEENEKRYGTICIQGEIQMKKIFAVLIALILCLAAVSALAATPEEARDKFLEFQESSGGEDAVNDWEWTYDEAKKELTATDEKYGVTVRFTEGADGNVGETEFLCGRDQIYMDDASFPWPLFCYNDLIYTYDELYPEMPGKEFMDDFNAYDIAYMAEDKGKYIKAYDNGIVFCAQFITVDGQELFQFRAVHF